MSTASCRTAEVGQVDKISRKEGAMGHTQSKMAVHKDELLISVQHAVDELGYAEQLHLQKTQRHRSMETLGPHWILIAESEEGDERPHTVSHSISRAVTFEWWHLSMEET